MVTLSDAILAINPDAEFEYDDIDNIFWRRKTKPISKDLILQKYRELKDIVLEKAAFEKANQLSDNIEEVQYNLDEYSRVTNKKIDRTNNDVIDLQDSFDSQRRLTSRKLSDLEQALTQLKNEVKDLQDPDKDKKK